MIEVSSLPSLILPSDALVKYSSETWDDKSLLRGYAVWTGKNTSI